MDTTRPIRLLIADDNLEICDILEDYFRLTPEVDLCGVAHDGEEALYRITQTQPDVVLLDLIMPKVDGLSVLERLTALDKLSLSEPMVRPRIIVCSAIGQEGFTRAALKLGADYYMIKPYDLSDLLNRIQLVASMGGVAARPATPAQPPPPPSGGGGGAVSRAVMELGVPAHMRGYQYINAALSLMLRESRPCSIVKDVYATLAQDFDTTTECVEGAIRKALHRAWSQNPAPFRSLLNDAGDGAPPANGRFLSALAQRLRLNGEGVPS